MAQFKIIDGEENPTESLHENDHALNKWYRSHGNHSSNRFSELKLINKNNIKNSDIAWIFKSGEPQDIQSNPIIVNGVIFTPISGNYIAAIDGYTGKLIWKTRKFKSTLAKRGLIYWKDPKTNQAKIFFSNEKNLISLNTNNGSFHREFGCNGLVRTGLNFLPSAIYKNQLILATFYHNIESYNILEGKLLWKLKFKETFSKRVGGLKYYNSLGNPWGGSSLDVSREFFYLVTGNPSYMFDGTRGSGPNRDANSIIAIDLNKKQKIFKNKKIGKSIFMNLRYSFVYIYFFIVKKILICFA